MNCGPIPAGFGVRDGVLCIGGIDARTLVERAYLGLRHDIVRGALTPGERLRVEHLKAVYDVGAGTLREALMLLVSDALVTAEGQIGRAHV